MNERNQITLLVIITAGLVLFANFGSLNLSQPEAVVEEYSAVFYSDNILEETFTYRINVPGKKFLFRYWELRMFHEPAPYSHIQFLDVDAPDGTIRYVKENTGAVTYLDETDVISKNEINRMAYRNEVGAYNPDGYEPCEYTVTYRFKVIPPLEYDEEYVHLNLMLANDHIPYKKVRVAFENPGYITNSYPHPPTLRRSTDKNMIVFTGSSAEDELLEFEFLMTPEALNTLQGAQREVEGVKQQTVEANRLLSAEYIVGSFLFWVARLAGFVMPFYLYMLWNRVGKEQDYVVPRTLSVIPNKSRTPWIVNLVFKKGVADYDEDGFHATMLDLHIKEKIRITPHGDDLTVEVLDDKGLDWYEGQIISFLKEISPDGVVTPKVMSRRAREGKLDSIGSAKLYNIQAAYGRLTSGEDDNIASEYTYNGRQELFTPGMACLGVVVLCWIGYTLSTFAESLFLRAGAYMLIPIIQIMIAAAFPSTLFGYWREDNLQEKLQWDAFRRHLDDFSQLDKYGPEDVSMWGRWLVYGTALGVGDKVAEAMEMLEVDYAPMRLVPTYHYWFRPMITAPRYQPPSRGGRGGGFSGGGGGGGFGGGGGAGGGGGGVR